MNSNISIVIPCYNGWKYMQKCLESMEHQSILPYEILVIDDCSTDDSYAKLNEYAANTELNLIVLRNQTNVGPGISRKYGIEASRGDYIAFCDCDDWYEYDFIEELTCAIKRENADVLIFDNYNAYDNRRIVSDTVKELQNDKKSILANIRMSLCRITVKREIIEQVVFPPLYYGEDGAVVPQIIAKADKFTLIDKPLYNYYYRIGSVSQKPSLKACQQMVTAFKTVKHEISKDYRIECEYIGIKYVCYSAVLSGFKSGLNTSEIHAVLNDFEKEFPNWHKNGYRHNLGKIKNLYLDFIKRRWFLLVKLMTFLHSFYIKFRKQ